MFLHRGDRVSEVDVVCYRDYTREGKRVISHSLLLQSVKLPDKMAADGTRTVHIYMHLYLYTCTYL